MQQKDVTPRQSAYGALDRLERLRSESDV